MRKLLAVLLALSAALAQAQTFSGKVVGITDGDTVRVLVAGHKQLKVRLDGIDAPEKAQPFGEKSRQWLAGRVFGKNVQVEQKDVDKYGRTVARLILNGRDVNVESVRAGMSWWYRQYAKKDGELREAERQARVAKRGLWRDPKPVAPWLWRHGGNFVGARNVWTPGSATEKETASRTVYVTDTGKKYHGAGCRYLAKSSNPVSLSDALAKGYSACSVCGGF